MLSTTTYYCLLAVVGIGYRLSLGWSKVGDWRVRAKKVTTTTTTRENCGRNLNIMKLNHFTPLSTVQKRSACVHLLTSNKK
jgi:hypothetical protein